MCRANTAVMAHPELLRLPPELHICIPSLCSAPTVCDHPWFPLSGRSPRLCSPSTAVPEPSDMPIGPRHAFSVCSSLLLGYYRLNLLLSRLLCRHRASVLNLLDELALWEGELCRCDVILLSTQTCKNTSEFSPGPATSCWA